MNLRNTTLILVILSAAFLFGNQLSSKDKDANNISVSSTTTKIKIADSSIDSKKAEELFFSNNKRINRIIPETNYENYSSQYGPLALSLRGTKIPAYFETDTDGNLIVTNSIKSVIEYFLAATGEEPIDVIIGRIEEYFGYQLEEPALSQALDVLVEYIGYKEALLELEELASARNAESTKGHSYLEMFELRSDIRVNNLSPVVYEAFFGDEDKLDLYTAKLLELKHESRSGADTSMDALQELELLLPDSEQIIKLRERIREQISQAKEQGASEQELYTLRASAYGHEAAERFAKADKKSEIWNQRYKEYSALRKQILNSKGLNEDDKNLELEALQNSLFNKYERKRLATLDKMNDSKTAL